MIVYTSIFCGYNELRSVQSNVKHLCYGDLHEQTSGWQMICIDPGQPTPRRNSRFVKINYHRVLPDHHWSIYIDGQFRLNVSPHELLAKFVGTGHLCDMYLFRHPSHHSQPTEPHCAYLEAEYCAEKTLDDPDLIRAQMAHYESKGLPRNSGMYHGGVIVRRDTLEVRTFCEQWWREVHRWSVRDQIALSYVVWQSHMQIGVLPGDQFSRLVTKTTHRGDRKEPA